MNSNKFSKNIFWVYSIIIQNKKFNAIKLSKNLKKKVLKLDLFYLSYAAYNKKA